MNLLVLFLALAAIFLFVFLFLKRLEKKSIFFPVKNVEIAPDYFNLPFEDIYLEASDQTKLNAWFIPGSKAELTLLFFHGNGGNISHRLHKISQLHNLGPNIFLLDYRGYGRSQKEPSVAGVYKDAQAALDFLVSGKKINPLRIIAYGESLGSALAVKLLADNKLGGLILEGAFSSGRDMAKVIFPCLPSWLIPDVFNNLKKIPQARGPKLFIHSKADEIVPIRLAKRLYQEASQPKEFIQIVGGHTTSYVDSSSEYLNAVGSFLAKVELK